MVVQETPGCPVIKLVTKHQLCPLNQFDVTVVLNDGCVPGVTNSHWNTANYLNLIPRAGQYEHHVLVQILDWETCVKCTFSTQKFSNTRGNLNLRGNRAFLLNLIIFYSGTLSYFCEFARKFKMCSYSAICT